MYISIWALIVISIYIIYLIITGSHLKHKNDKIYNSFVGKIDKLESTVAKIENEVFIKTPYPFSSFQKYCGSKIKNLGIDQTVLLEKLDKVIDHLGIEVYIEPEKDAELKIRKKQK